MNKYTKILLIVGVVVISYFLFKKNNSIPKNIPDSLTKSFVNTKENFSFYYPKNLTISDQTILDTNLWRNNNQTLGELLVSVSAPKSLQPNTNFSSAKFNVGMSPDAKAVQNCLVAENGEVFVEEKTINNVIYKKSTLSDAGAGNFYETTSYRTIRNNKCYAVEYIIHYTNIGAYSPDQGIKEFDKDLIKNMMEEIAQSFKFID